jgi:hypothetical protein
MAVGVAVMLIVLPLAACTGRSGPIGQQTSPVQPTTGVVSGVGSPCEGPGVRNPDALRAIVALRPDHSGEGAQLIEKVRRPYRFSFAVRAGTYTLIEAGARSKTVHVHSGRTTFTRLPAICI